MVLSGIHKALILQELDSRLSTSGMRKAVQKFQQKRITKKYRKLNARQSSRIKRLNNHERSKNTQYSQKRRLVEIFNTGFPPLRE